MTDWDNFKQLLGRTPVGKTMIMDFTNATYKLEVKEIKLKDSNDLNIDVADEINIDEKIS